MVFGVGPWIRPPRPGSARNRFASWISSPKNSGMLSFEQLPCAQFLEFDFGKRGLHRIKGVGCPCLPLGGKAVSIGVFNIVLLVRPKTMQDHSVHKGRCSAVGGRGQDRADSGMVSHRENIGVEFAGDIRVRG